MQGVSFTVEAGLNLLLTKLRHLRVDAESNHLLGVLLQDDYSNGSQTEADLLKELVHMPQVSLLDLMKSVCPLQVDQGYPVQ